MVSQSILQFDSPAPPLAMPFDAARGDASGRSSPRRGARVLGSFIDALDWDQTIDTIAHWAARRESRMIATCNVHSVVTAASDPEHRRALAAADLCTADGAPVAWLVGRRGFPGQQRINGPDLMWRYLAAAERYGHGVYFYGEREATLERLRQSALAAYPALKICGLRSPPFRPLSDSEQADDIRRINASGAKVLFVALGCPRQEKWIAAQLGKINAVMIGVGAAFAFHAGLASRAPQWMQRYGLEWLHRLMSEPRRLWRRYLVTNTLFLTGIVYERLFPKKAAGRFGAVGH